MTTEMDAPAGISRRQFLFVTAATLVTGCRAMAEQSNSGASGSGANGHERVVNAGPVSKYAADGLYDAFRDQGFFLVHKGDKLVALSSYCTHRKCKLEAESNRSFNCPCHGSTFDPGGKVTEGPAKRDLPTLPSFTNEAGELCVRVPNL
ncbi:MAG TPA: Rieske 2Fe-2S domain-containing protein [Verrucomicrobiae bacterium]|nr:Rieske 2Fe-2S domain-containing protein [Verrucomicrobiae bacterium]